jgi:hypothetical protein
MYEKDGGRLKESFAGSEERSGAASRFRADRLEVSPKAYTVVLASSSCFFVILGLWLYAGVFWYLLLTLG